MRPSSKAWRANFSNHKYLWTVSHKKFYKNDSIEPGGRHLSKILSIYDRHREDQ